MEQIAKVLREIVQAASEELLMLDAEVVSRRPAPGKWSAKEIIGHLIDSAANNHRRFVTAQLKNDLVFDGYQQDEWVRLQGYQTRDWNALVLLWKQYNLHLAEVIEQVPAEIAFRETRAHNFHQIAWQVVPEGEATTLAYFVEDYVGHLQHHISQILN